MLFESLAVVIAAIAFAIGFEAMIEQDEFNALVARIHAFVQRLTLDPPESVQAADAALETFTDSYMPPFYHRRSGQFGQLVSESRPLGSLANWLLILYLVIAVTFLSMSLDRSVSDRTSQLILASLLFVVAVVLVKGGAYHREHLRKRTAIELALSFTNLLKYTDASVTLPSVRKMNGGNSSSRRRPQSPDGK